MKRMRRSVNHPAYTEEALKDLRKLEEACWKAVTPLLKKYPSEDVELAFQHLLSLRFAFFRVGEYNACRGERSTSGSRD